MSESNEDNLVGRFRFAVGFYTIRFHKEKPGVISAKECWVIFHGPWMYGPRDTLLGVVYEMLRYWTSDHCLVG